MSKFAKLFRGRIQDSELSKKKEIVEANPLEQDEQNSAEQLYGPLYGSSSVNEGQVTIYDTVVSPADGELLVGFFISNGLSQKVKFDNVPLVLIDPEKRVLARQLFDGESVGVIAGGSAKACVVRFDQDHVFDEDIPEECQICFDVPAKRSESIQIDYQTLPENITEDQQQELERVLAELPPMKPGEVNFSPLHAQITSQSELLTTLIIRNATDKLLNLEQMPLVVFDAHREELARGMFNINDLTIEPFKAILWTFNFGSVLQNKDIDLSSWYINLVQ